MKKRVKVFQAGKYPQGDYPLDRVRKIFENTKDFVQGIFIHSSHWEDEGKKPINCGEFSNFCIDKQEVYADLELNNEGMQFFQKGVFKGISVEIVKDKLDKIALLPLGVKPAIVGAEFEEYFKINNVIEFEEIIIEGGNMTVEEVKAFLMNAGIGDKIEVMSAIVGSLSEADTRAARALAYEFADKTEITVDEFAKKKGIEVEIKEAKVAKTEEEIRAEITAEFEAKEVAKTELQEFEEVLKKKVLPAHQEAYKMAFQASQGNSELLEFEEGKGKMTGKDHLFEKVKAMGDIDLTQEFAKREGSEEFSEEQKAAREMMDAKKRAEGNR